MLYFSHKLANTDLSQILKLAQKEKCGTQKGLKRSQISEKCACQAALLLLLLLCHRRTVLACFSHLKLFFSSHYKINQMHFTTRQLKMLIKLNLKIVLCAIGFQFS